MADVSERVYPERKVKWVERFLRNLDEYKNILIVNMDNVGSPQTQQVQMDLRGRAEFMNGKNTMFRRVLRIEMEKRPELAALLPLMVGNICLVFTNENLKEIREEVVSNRVPAAAKAGIIAPSDVFIPAGPTGMDPGKTAFYQALNIGTKIVKGAIEITAQVHLITKGEKVSASAVTLLSMMDIRPFDYGFKVVKIYDNGSVYDPEVLDLTEADMLAKFGRSVSVIAALGLKIGYPTLASLPHSLANAFKTLLAVSVNTDYTFKESEKFKEYLADPSKFAVAAAPAAGASAAAAEPEPEEESEEESEAEEFDLFD